MNYLIVAAHPDDEVLGAGATAYKLSHAGHTVDICIMSSEARARNFRPDDDELYQNFIEASKILGFRERYEGAFPNIEMNTVPHLKLVRFIENALVHSLPDVVITHHPHDLNNDHFQTSLACQAAIRLFQRRKDVRPVAELWYMEVPSATDWSLSGAAFRFSPNVFIEVGRDGVEKKSEALSKYKGVMRDYPHPRSREVIKSLAAMRGGQSGLVYAEGFECAFRRIIVDG